MPIKEDILRDLNYGDMLCTPGWDVEFAVGTTYSLDLRSLLIVPYSLGMFGDLSGQVKQSSLFILESIRRSTEHFVVFCQRGGIHMPKETQAYYPLLEDAIVEVQDRKNHLSSFHPKLWVIRERNSEDGCQRLKVVIMSKNLVIANNLDVVVNITGKINTSNSHNTKKHKPLHDFLERLSTYTTGQKRKQILQLAEDLYHVKAFEVDESRFEPEGYEFLPFFYGEQMNSNVRYPEDFQGTSVMTISPFIQTSELNKINKRVRKNGERVLVTRSDYVTQEVFDLYKEGGSIWCMNDQMVNNNIAKIDLHAKSYMVVNPLKESGIFLYLGSANATGAAFCKNSEILLRLKLKRGQHVFDKFKSEFLQLNDEDESLVYEQLLETVDTASDNEYSELEKWIRKLLTANFKASVANGKVDSMYDVNVKVKFKKGDYKITISPLLAPSLEMRLEEDMTFRNMPTHKLSEFYLLKADDGIKPVNEVIKIPTKGIPEDRNDEIFRSIVDTKEKFYNYISFMLCDDPEMFAMELSLATEQLDKTSTDGRQRKMPLRIYEQMLKLAASHPERLTDLDDVMRIVKDKSFTKEFLGLFETVRPIIPKLKQLL